MPTNGERRIRHRPRDSCRRSTIPPWSGSSWVHAATLTATSWSRCSRLTPAGTSTGTRHGGSAACTSPTAWASRGISIPRCSMSWGSAPIWPLPTGNATGCSRSPSPGPLRTRGRAQTRHDSRGTRSGPARVCSWLPRRLHARRLTRGEGCASIAGRPWPGWPSSGRWPSWCRPSRTAAAPLATVTKSVRQRRASREQRHRPRSRSPQGRSRPPRRQPRYRKTMPSM
jgi:hypothetical protein